MHVIIWSWSINDPARLTIRPGKVDSLFPSNTFNFDAGGHYSLLILLKLSSLELFIHNFSRQKAGNNPKDNGLIIYNH